MGRSSNDPSLYGKSAAIASGQTVSGAVDMGDQTLCGVILPAAFTGTALKFQMSQTLAGTYVAVQDGAGSDYSVVVAAAKYVPVDYTKFLGARFLKVVSGTAEGGARTVVLAGRGFLH